ncbi:MAG: signal peptidase I [Candidatus Saccharibacteria bacterium]|nr:signal peptidase I [Candidatus Saccharibacteria bacterium]
MKTSRRFYSVLVILILLLVGLVSLGRIFNIYTFFVSTPSMGTTAPVGSLILTSPKNDYQKDEIIVFKRSDRVYVHRIVDKTESGFKTKGDMNSSADAWMVKSEDIIGEAKTIMKKIGWLWKALPWLIIGIAIVYFISCLSWIDPLLRWPIRLIGGAFVLMLVTLWLHPWINFGMLGFVPDNVKGVNMHVVNTGIFAINVQGTILKSGEDAVVNIPYSNDNGWFVLVPRPALRFWEMVFAIIFCSIPLLISIFVKIPQNSDKTQRLRPKSKRQYVLGIISVIILTLLILAMQFSSQGAWAANIKNDRSTAKSATYFTCRNSLGNLSSPRPLFAYSMDTKTSREGNFFIGYKYYINDISGNNKRGYYSSQVYESSLINTSFCNRDQPHKATEYGGNYCLSTRETYNNPTTFSLEVRFKTGNKVPNNGKMIGFGNVYDAFDGSTDRHIYLDKDGRIVFGVYYNYQVMLASTPAGINYADNNWHHVVATVSSTAGAKLYVDGQLAGQNPNARGGENYQGYWKFGCGKLDSGWKNADGTAISGTGINYFSGQLQFGAVYDRVLTEEQIREHYLSGK